MTGGRGAIMRRMLPTLVLLGRLLLWLVRKRAWWRTVAMLLALPAGESAGSADRRRATGAPSGPTMSFRDTSEEPPLTARMALEHSDAVDCLAPLANRLVPRRARPTTGRIRVRDGVLVPLSRRSDRWIGYRFGSSLLAVRRQADACAG